MQVTPSFAPSLAVPPRLVGIVNITVDSFSDGGRFLSQQDALAHARRLRADGADVVELGPAASNPASVRVPAREEIRRLTGVIEPLVAEGVAVSVDSYQPETQRFAVAHGAGYLNDIKGFADPATYADLAASRCRLVVMHSVQRGPATVVHTDARATRVSIERFFDERLAALESAGVARDRLIIDPGLGYFLGAAPEPSVAALADLPALRAAYGVPVLVSPSRKSFLRALTGRSVDGIGPAVLAAELFAALRGVDYIRTHDVAAIRDALTVFRALLSASSPPPSPRDHEGSPPL